MNAVVYLFQVSACMGIFYLFYYLLLSRFTFFTINRWYLITTLALCFIIPLLTITVQQPESYPQVIQQVVYVNSIQNLSPLTTMTDLPAETGKTITWIAIIKVLYLIAVGVLFLRLILMVIKFFTKVRKRKCTKIDGVQIVQGGNKISNGSFFNFIFLNDEELSADELQQIMAHEMLHVKLYHSVDRILVKMAQVFLWFNPFVYLYARAIEENHEFEVDRAVSNSTNRNQYAELLFHLSVARQATLYHSFSMVPLKKRITMLFTKPTNRMKKVIYLLVVPVVLISCLAFAKIEKTDIKNINLAKAGREVLSAIESGQDNVIEQLNQSIQLPSVKITKRSIVRAVDDSTVNYSAVVGAGSTPFKKNALVKIDGKVYPTSILYEMSNKGLSGVSVNPITGEVNLTTQNGQIFYLTAEERVKIHMERAAYGASKNKWLSPLAKTYPDTLTTAKADDKVSGTIVKENLNSDTLEYNAQAFKVTTNAALLEIVKQLPNVTTSNEAIFVDGKKLSNFLINYAPYNGSVLSGLRSLPASIISYIQIIGTDAKNEAPATINVITKPK